MSTFERDERWYTVRVGDLEQAAHDLRGLGECDLAERVAAVATHLRSERYEYRKRQHDATMKARETLLRDYGHSR